MKNLIMIIAIPMLISGILFGQANLDSALVAYYPFNGNANDESGNGNNGTVNGATLTNDRFGNVNSAYNFDGIDDYIELTDQGLRISDYLTLSCWVKLGTNPNETIFLNKMTSSQNDANYRLGIINSNEIKALVHTTDVTQTNPPSVSILYEEILNTNAFNHIALTFNTDTKKVYLYLNGLLTDSLTTTYDFLSTRMTNMPPVNGNLIFGSVIEGNGNQWNFFNGVLDDIRVYNRTLTEPEVDSLYHEGGWGTEPQLSGDIGGMTLTPDEEWLVLDSVWVEDGDTLTILPGTVIKFTPGIDAYLLIKRGGYILAQGTEEAPIVFTSAAENPHWDDWLAVQVLGKGTGQNTFWEEQVDHNAGILEYVNIEYSRWGLGLINLGNGTQVNHISKAYSESGYYILGGNVTMNNLSAVGIWHTVFYITGGYTGSIDEVFINGTLRAISIKNTHGAYWDYDEQTDPDAVPRTNPTINHLTMMNVRGRTIEFRRGGVGTVTNSVIYDYAWDWGGIRCADEYLLDQISVDNVQHFDWHAYNLTNNSYAEQVVTNVVEADPLFDGFVPTNSDGRGAMTGGDWLSNWGSYLPLDDIGHVYLTWIGPTVPGDTVYTDLCFGLSEGNLLSSADVELYYDPLLFEVLSIEPNPDFFPENEVSVVSNIIDDIIYISLASDSELDTDEAWEAIQITLRVNEFYDDTTIYIEPISILVNESSQLYTDFLNGTNVYIPQLMLGDVSQSGDISSYDASLILQYLVGNIGLNDAQLWNADVSGMEGVTAYDASLIQQYMVGLIDIFPADTGAYAAPAEGVLTMTDQEVLAGQSIEVPLTLAGGDNILSFEQKIDFNPEHLSFTEVVWSEYLGEFLIELNTEDGELQFAGSGSLPDGQEGLFATLHFVVNEGFEEDETVITLQRLRWNEEEALENSASATLTIGLAIGNGNEGLPTEYRLAQNYPNPFNPITTIRYDLPEQTHVYLIIYDILGREVRTLVNKLEESGYRSMTWNGTNDYGEPVGAGVYLYRISTDKFTKVNKMILLK